MSNIRALVYDWDENMTPEMEKLLGIKKPVEFGAALAKRHMGWIEQAVLEWREKYYPTQDNNKVDTQE